MRHTQQMRERLRSTPCVIDSHTHVGIDPVSFRNGAYPYCLSFRDLVLRMDQLGIDASVVFPFPTTACLTCTGHSVEFASTPECRFSYEMENRHLFREVYSICDDATHRALPFVIVDPTRHVPQQVELIQELHETYGVFGLKICTSYIHSYVCDLLKKGRVFLDLAEKENWPLVLHCSYEPKGKFASVEDVIAVADAYPSLRMAVAHAARFHQATIKAIHARPNCFVDTSAFAIHCLATTQGSAIVPQADKRFPATYSDQEGVFAALANACPDSMIWGSDQPFDSFIQEYRYPDGTIRSCDLRSPFGREKELLDALPENERRNVSYNNTLRFLFGTD